MPNYTTDLSFELKMTSLSEAEEAKAFLDVALEDGVTAALSAYPSWSKDMFSEAHLDFAGGLSAHVEGAGDCVTLHLYEMEGADIDFCLDFLAGIWDRFDRQDSFTFSWANSCSKPVPGAFGGGTAAIGRDASGGVRVEAMSTDACGDILLDQIKSKTA